MLIFDVTGETEKFNEAMKAYAWGWSRMQMAQIQKKPRAPLVLDLDAAKREA